jgi:RNA polymerase sigma-70 factor (ECF subfamily)
LGTPKNLNTGKDLEKAFKKWNVLLYNYVYARVQSVELAEEITQDTFFKAWRSRELFDETKSSLKNWFFVIAINLLRDEFRKGSTENEEIDEQIADKTDIEEDTKNIDLISYVFSKLKLLSEKDQELIALRYKTDLKMAEIGEIMEMEEPAVKVAIHRAIKKLKEICNKM